METDEALLRAYRNGDRGAGSALLERLRPDVAAVCRAVSGDREIAEEAVQETCLRFVKGVDGYRDGARVRPWVLQIARNATRDLLRRRRPHVSSDDVPEPAATDARLLRREDEEAVARHLSGLPAALREAMVLKYVRDLPNDEIAEALGIGLAALWARLSRARRLLRERIHADL